MKKGKKYNYRLLSIILSCLLTFNNLGCGKKIEDNNMINVLSPEQRAKFGIYKVTEETEINKTDNVTDESLNSPVIETLSLKNTQVCVENDKKEEKIEEVIPLDDLSVAYIDNLNNIKVVYKNEELYLSEQQVEKEIKKANDKSKCEYVHDQNLESLIDKINENSQSFVNKDRISFLDDEINYKLLYKVLNEINILGTNNINQDFHTLEDYSIVVKENGYDHNVARVDEENKVLYIYQYMVDFLMESYGYDYETIIYHYLFHEINHIRQLPCSCNQSIDISYDNLGLMSFIFESSAESSIRNQFINRTTREIDYIYEYERQYENELFLLGMFNDDINNYYNAIYDQDLNGLYNFFDLKSEDEIKEFYKIIYSIDAKEKRNDFIDKYYGEDNEEFISTNELEKTVGFSYKESIFKMFLIKLINYTATHEDFTLLENLVLFNIAKSNLVINYTSYDDNNDSISLVYDVESVEQIEKMEKLYVDYLIAHYNVSEEHIRETENITCFITIETMKYIINGEEIKNSSNLHIEAAEKILEKFPVSFYIIYTNNLNQRKYDNFVNKVLEYKTTNK